MAIYVREPLVADFIPWRYALPERVALGSLSTELGDVNTCLKPCRGKSLQSESFITNGMDSRTRVSRFSVSPSTDLQSRKRSQHIETLATGHHGLRFHRS